MSRPTSVPTASNTADWVSRLNDNFEKVLDAPIPVCRASTLPLLTAAFDPKLYKDCWAIVGQDLHTSDGSTWGPYREQLTEIVDLDPATATLQDVQDAYNALISDMQSKGWMLS